jgi:RNA polymerase sigma factor (sigma-70 family)
MKRSDIDQAGPRVKPRAIPPPRGDEARLFREHSRQLLRRVTHDLGGSADLAEDACAFAWLQLLRRQPERTAIGAWLRVVARHEGYRLWRVRRTESSFEHNSHSRNDGATGEPLGWEELLPAPVDTELAFEARELLRSLTTLKPQQRAALSLRLAGYSYREIIERLGVTYTWANRHITEGRQQLRRSNAAAEAGGMRRSAMPPDGPARPAHAFTD